jgi:hypothetical protein
MPHLLGGKDATKATFRAEVLAIRIASMPNNKITDAKAFYGSAHILSTGKLYFATIFCAKKEPAP